MPTCPMRLGCRCPVRAAQPHQVQAVSRGEAQGVLSINFQWQLAPVEEVCYRQLAEKGEWLMLSTVIC